MRNDYDARKRSFFEKYPDCPVSEPISCLDLVMRRENAEAILRGDKRAVYRTYSQRNCDKLYDWNVLEYGEKVAEEDKQDYLEFAKPLRVVEKIHFHPEYDSWWLDVECRNNFIARPCREDVRFIEEEYGNVELKDLQLELGDRVEPCELPLFFFFALGQVLDSKHL